MFREEIKSLNTIKKNFLYRFLKILSDRCGILQKYYTLKKLYYSTQVTYQIRALLRKKQTRPILITYDLSCSPVSYGDFFQTLLLCRFFMVKNKKVELAVITSTLRKDMQEHLPQEILNQRLKEFKAMAQILLKTNPSTFISWKEFSESYLQQAERYEIVPSLKWVKKRKAFYQAHFNVLQNLSKTLSPKELSEFLLKAEEFNSFIVKPLPFSDFISWHVRYWPYWENGRSLSESEFIKTHQMLQKMFPDKPIVLISDTKGTKVYEDFAKKNHIPVYSCKAYTASFLGDVALILKSSFFLQIRGGGVGNSAFFSTVPYLFVTRQRTMNELFLFSEAPPWATPKQKLYFEAACEDRPLKDLSYYIECYQEITT